MFQRIRAKLYQWRKGLLIPPTVAGLIIATGLTGILQPLELLFFDQFFRWRSPEGIDPRILIVTIDESDIATLKQWPLSDSVLAQLIQTIKSENPRVIGLNIFRDFPISPGEEKLNHLFSTTPNLIGIEQIIGQKIEPPTKLSQLDQVGFSDLVVDNDGKIRRDLVSLISDQQKQKLSFSMMLALTYLEKEGITPELGNSDKDEIIIGKAQLFPLTKNSGNYINLDYGGYQILLNYRGKKDSFQTLSLLDVLNQNYPKNLFNDRLVLIGVIADSIDTDLLTPFHGSKTTSGTIIQANTTSQILSAALDNRPLIKVWSEPLEWLWILTWTSLGMGMTYYLLNKNIFPYNSFIKYGLFLINNVFLGFGIVSSSYLLFVQGWWIPTVTPLTATLIVSVFSIIDRWKYLATFDPLTQIPNRLYFDNILEQTWLLNNLYRGQMALILCDVDHFKQYNDTYGHPAGDTCLYQVAQCLRIAIRRTDFVARYGGEEFAIILPNTGREEASQVAQRILEEVRNLRIEHQTSLTSNYVTLSCGVASLCISGQGSTKILIEQADKALYQAKKLGRNQVKIYESFLLEA
ncbi:MAG: CHASE2 domain-containing protein [Crocosphaera sp.]|nr:CHASE2 domain-containing protein [Crocosphaera sp.]